MNKKNNNLFEFVTSFFYHSHTITGRREAFNLIYINL